MSDTASPLPGAQESPDRPTIDELSAFMDNSGALGVTFAGRVGKGGAVSLVEIELLDDAGQPFHVFSAWFSYLDRPNRFVETASVAHVEVDAETFRGFTTHVDSSLTSAPLRVRVSLGERAELRGEPREVDVAAASPKLVELGARCDPFEVLTHCPQGTLCDVPSGVDRDSPTCLEPVASCPLDLPALEGTYEGTNADSPDQTLASCTSSRGNLGNEQGHVFVAPAAGTYRFAASSVTVGSNAAATLFVRSHCQYAHAKAELGCVHQLDAGADPNEPLSEKPLTLDVSLSAGERVYVFVEAWWINGADYTLSVTPVN